jgi:hypothetical protein
LGEDKEFTFMVICFTPIDFCNSTALFICLLLKLFLALLAIYKPQACA